MTLARPVMATATMAVTLALFVARPLLPSSTGGLFGLFGALLVVGAAWPLSPSDGEAPPRTGGAFFVLVAGMAACGLARMLGGGHPPVPATAGYLATVTFAAVAEEIFFRRFAYAVLCPGGAVFAVGGSSVLFALAHVTVYGWWVLPVDVAVGVMLGWQRWASGSWTVPAVTHVVANLLVVV